MGLVYVSATVAAKDGMEAELEKVLAGVVAEVRKEQGCIRYDLHRSEYGNVFFFYEIWEDMAALAAHGKTPHMKAMQEASANLVGGAPVINTWEAVEVL